MLFHKLRYIYDADSQAVAFVWYWFTRFLYVNDAELQAVECESASLTRHSLWYVNDAVHKLLYVNDADSQAVACEWLPIHKLCHVNDADLQAVAC